MKFPACFLVVLFLLPSAAPCAEANTATGSNELGVPLVLITLDTTRSDVLGCYGGLRDSTPHLDRLAAAGTIYRRAISPAPLTLPAHATLLTGLDPPEHGVRSNGAHALDPQLPTIATVLSSHGYRSAAFIASRVLDRRFGLGRGFQIYDDVMVAERVGEYGYPERDAVAVTDAAVAWIESLTNKTPFFLWVHYYDPHAPYAAPGANRNVSRKLRYAAEVAAVDRQIGRLLASLPGSPADHLVAVVGDHGEALGEHGEDTHGLFLYRAVLEVPLILAGPGVTKGGEVHNTVAIRSLAATLLRLLDATPVESSFGSALPDGRPEDASPAVYSEARMPNTAYGWVATRSLTTDRWRYIAAPRPELYDLAHDRNESNNLLTSEPEEVHRLEQLLKTVEAQMSVAEAAPVQLDHQAAAALRALGYVAAHERADDGIDAKDGVGILAEMKTARTLLQRGENRQAVALLERLAQRNPSNIPLTTRLAEARFEAGLIDEALPTYEMALALDPGSEFLRLNLAHALRRSGRPQQARAAYQAVLEVDPRSAPAWLFLADLAGASGGHKEEAAVLTRAVAAGSTSVTVLLRLARLQLAAGKCAAADELLADACDLDPRSAEPWLVRAEVAMVQDQLETALDSCRRAASLAPTAAEPALCLGRTHLARGDSATARAHLRRAAALGRGTAAGDEATRLLSSPDPK